MKQVDQQFLFGTEINPPLGWRSYAGSFAAHVAIAALLLLIPVAVVKRQQIKEFTTLVAPQLKPYKPPPPKLHAQKLVARNEVAPRPKLQLKPPAEVKPPAPPPVQKELPPAPKVQIAAAEPKPLPKIQAAEPAPAPRPQVHTGVFGSQESAKKVETAKELKVGGFGDPNGAKQSAVETKQPMLLAKVGSFEMPQGDGAAGGHSKDGRGVVRTTSFGAAEGNGGTPGNGTGAGRGSIRTAGFGSPEGGGTGAGTGGNGRGGTVKTGGFGENTAGPAPTAQRPKPVAPTTTPVEIISKPKPLYTPEARQLHLEGEVALEVIFTANGSVQVMRVVRGLGHGLDESAQKAAAQIRFRPATRDGAPVDTRATVRIVFELT